MYDVFFVSYDEPMADAHWGILKSNVAAARRVHGVAGIHAAHRHCANISRTSHFFVIDADNEVLDYDFTYKVPSYDAQYVHLWQAKNPLNGLVYGWGGVKLFPKRLVKQMSESTLDMTTSFELKIMPEVKSVTHFNYAPFETWRSAFREAVKLTLARDNDEAKERLEVWKTRAAGPFAEHCLRGAQEGAAYAESFHADPEAIRKINDYGWLHERFATGEIS